MVTAKILGSQNVQGVITLLINIDPVQDLTREWMCLLIVVLKASLQNFNTYHAVMASTNNNIITSMRGDLQLTNPKLYALWGELERTALQQKDYQTL